MHAVYHKTQANKCKYYIFYLYIRFISILPPESIAIGENMTLARFVLKHFMTATIDISVLRTDNENLNETIFDLCLSIQWIFTCSLLMHSSLFFASLCFVLHFNGNISYESQINAVIYYQLNWYRSHNYGTRLLDCRCARMYAPF